MQYVELKTKNTNKANKRKMLINNRMSGIK